GDQSHLARSERLAHVIHEIASDASIVQIRNRSNQAAGDGAKRHTHRATEDANQTPDRGAGQRAPRRRFIAVLYFGGTVGVLRKHRGRIHRDTAIVVQLLKGARRVISCFFVIKHDYQHSIHDCFSPFEVDYYCVGCRYRKKTTGALFGTENGVAVLRSLLSFPNTGGLALICFVRAFTRFWSFGWSDNICGISCFCAFLKSSKSHTRPHGLYPAWAQISDPVRSARASASRE